MYFQILLRFIWLSYYDKFSYNYFPNYNIDQMVKEAFVADCNLLFFLRHVFTSCFVGPCRKWTTKNIIRMKPKKYYLFVYDIKDVYSCFVAKHLLTVCVNPLRSVFRLRKSLSKTHSIYGRFSHFFVMYTKYLVELSSICFMRILTNFCKSFLLFKFGNDQYI